MILLAVEHKYYIEQFRCKKSVMI